MEQAAHSEFQNSLRRKKDTIFLFLFLNEYLLDKMEFIWSLGVLH